VSVLALAGLAHVLKLGGDVRLSGRDEALRLAAEQGFDAQDIAVDRAGMAALARDATGRFLLIRRHGVHFVARQLVHPIDGRLDQRYLTLGTGERSFGRITLDLGDDAAVWAASLRRLT